jgi:hypothetical protein
MLKKIGSRMVRRRKEKIKRGSLFDGVEVSVSFEIALLAFSRFK